MIGTGFAGGYGAPVVASNGNPGDWLCPGCDNNNYAFRSQCFRCQVDYLEEHC
jgi:hypothetical protein